MSNLYRGPSIDASYQVLVHLAKWFQRRTFLEIDQSETRIACGSHVCWWIGTKWAIFRGPSIDTSYQVSLHLAERFHRRRLKCEKLTDDGRRMPSDGKSSHWQGDLKRALNAFLYKSSLASLKDSDGVKKLFLNIYIGLHSLMVCS